MCVCVCLHVYIPRHVLLAGRSLKIHFKVAGGVFSVITISV